MESTSSHVMSPQYSAQNDVEMSHSNSNISNEIGQYSENENCFFDNATTKTIQEPEVNYNSLHN